MGTEEARVRVAVIGAGPSGFYTAQQLLEAGVEVHLYDSLPTPFGLVRFGVAPDYPKIKSVIRVFERIADHPSLRFFGRSGPFGGENGTEVRANTLQSRGFRVALPSSGLAQGASADQLGRKQATEWSPTGIEGSNPPRKGVGRGGFGGAGPGRCSDGRPFTPKSTGDRFFGGVEIGRDVRREELLACYHAIIYAVGAAADRPLRIPGEARAAVLGASAFVGWYNGHPACTDLDVDLRADRAVVIGNGNVALDVARLLVLEPRELARSDIADHALAALRDSQIREVVVVGRRGAAQSSFTEPELRELGRLVHTNVMADPAHLAEASAWASTGSSAGTTGVARKLVTLRDVVDRAAGCASHRIDFRFLRTPVEILGDGTNGPVRAVRFALSELDLDGAGGVRARKTDHEETIECGLVVRAIGYRTIAIPGVPHDDATGRIPNEDGRVIGPDGERLFGEYVSGWCKRGSTGVIGTNKKDAAQTVSRLLEDLAAGRMGDNVEQTTEEVDIWLHEKLSQAIPWQGCQAIDRHEQQAGQADGRPRVKLVRVEQMLEVARPVLDAEALPLDRLAG